MAKHGVIMNFTQNVPRCFLGVPIPKYQDLALSLTHCAKSSSTLSNWSSKFNRLFFNENSFGSNFAALVLDAGPVSKRWPSVISDQLVK